MSTTAPGARREFHLFVYDAWMSDQAQAARLAGAKLVGPAATEPVFDLVDLGGSQMALVSGGQVSVHGEVFTLDAQLLSSLDVEKGHPLRYKRLRIKLADGREAEAYTLDADQVRGRRRIRSGDFRTHMAPATPDRQGSAWSKWARGRASGR